MKIAFFGYDFLWPVIEQLIVSGHTLTAAYSFPVDNIFMFHTRMETYCTAQKIPFTTDKPDLGQLEEIDCDIIIIGGYPYKLAVSTKIPYAINIHPSLLPKGRGMMPSPHILLNHPDAAGVTIHKLTDRIDAGDILWQEPIHLETQDDIESYSARIALKIQHILPDILENIEGYWRDAKPQNEGFATTFSIPDQKMRHIDWSDDITLIQSKGRAFGRFGCTAQIGEHICLITHFNSWREEHSHSPGAVICTLSKELIIACRDGYICVKEAFPLEAS